MLAKMQILESNKHAVFYTDILAKMQIMASNEDVTECNK